MAADPKAPRVTTRTVSWDAIVLAADPEWHKEYAYTPHYEFSNGRKFSDWWQTSGPYKA